MLGGSGVRASSGATIAAADAQQFLAPTGVLRAAINLSNILLVTGRGPVGEPVGVAPSMAEALAQRLGVPLELVPYPNPGALGDAAPSGCWDVGLIGAEPQRANLISFSDPYIQIEATYLVRGGSEFRRCEEANPLKDFHSPDQLPSNHSTLRADLRGLICEFFVVTESQAKVCV